VVVFVEAYYDIVGGFCEGAVYGALTIQWTRIDVQALKLVPLGLEDMGMWDPKEEFWAEEDESIEDCIQKCAVPFFLPLFFRLHYFQFCLTISTH